MSDNTNKPSFHISINGLNIISDEAPYIILGDQVKNTDEQIPTIEVSENVKGYSKLYYTTDLKALGFIFRKLTLRSSSLSYANLNDKMEKERVGVSQFAGSRFITCFSHEDHENVHFWYNYGGVDRSKKVLIEFKNFADNLKNVIHLDYCLLDGNKKGFFAGDEYYKAINQNGIFGTMLGLPKTHTEYDLRNCIESIEMFDIDYLSVKDEAFSKDYSEEVSVNFNSENVVAYSPVVDGIKVFLPNCLGKQKSNPWAIECETRILCRLHNKKPGRGSYHIVTAPIFQPWSGVSRFMSLIPRRWDKGQAS